MERPARRSFLRLAAASLALGGPLSRAAPCEPELPPRAGRRPVVVFLDDSLAPQGGRLAEFRSRLAAHGLGESRLRFEAVDLDASDVGAVECTMRRAKDPRLVAYCTASTLIASRAGGHGGGIPLVFASRADPVVAGLVDGMGKRTTNAAGFTFDTPVPIDRKCFELAAEAFPGTRRLLVIADADWAQRPGRERDLALARERFGYATRVLTPRSPGGLEELLGTLELRAGDAYYVAGTDLLLEGFAPVMAFFTRHRLPHLFGEGGHVRGGALMTYAPLRTVHWDAMAVMVRLIVEGVQAREIPVQRPTEFELAVNVAQWQRFGLAMPRRILRRAHVLA